MTQPPPLIDALRRLAGPGPDDRSDDELLARFVGGDAGAFSALVHRHGPLVWGACRRRARDPHAAEDAFQTTFLALARNAAAVRKPGALGAWLHRVAVRCTAALRTTREPMSALPTDLPARVPGPAAAATGRDLERAIDAEVDALPEHYRLAFVLCEVEERTASEAAAALGCAVGTVESRLTRARERLRARLARRGITAGALVGLGLAADPAPASARSAAIALGTGVAPASVARAALADRVAHAPIVGPAAVGIGLAGGSVLLIGLGGLLWGLTGGDPAPPPPGGPPHALAARGVQLPMPDLVRRNRDNFPLPPEAIARIGDPWLRHAVTPDRLAYSSDGRFLATGAPGDRWLRVWDLAAHRPRAHLPLGPNEEPMALALSPDGTRLRAVIRGGGAAHLCEYDTPRAEEVGRRPIPEPTNAVFDPAGAWLAVTQPGEVHLVDAATAKDRWQAGVASTDPPELAFAGPNRLAVLTAGGDRVRLFDLASGSLADELVEPGARLALPAFSPDGRTMAVWLPMPNRVRVWDVAERRAVNTLTPAFAASALAVNPDGSEVAVFTAWRGATLWSARTPGAGVQVHSFGARAGRFSPDGSTLAVASHEPHLGKVELVDGRTGRSKASAEPQVPLPLRFEPDGDRVLLRGLTHWVDWSTTGDSAPRAIAPWSTAADTPWMDAEEWAALSPDRTLIARSATVSEGEDEYALDIVDGTTRARRLRIPLENAPHRPTFSPDGRTVYAVVDKFVRGWDVATGRQVVRGNQPAGELVYRLVASPDGRYLATALLVLADRQRVGSIQVWDADTGESVLTAQAGDARPFVAFSADGKRFAAAALPDRPAQHASEVRVWDLDSRSVVARFPGYDGQPAFSPDGRTLAITRDDRVELIEFASGQVRHVFHHQGPVEPALAWRADGRVLASASPEAPVYLWDVAGDRTGPTRAWGVVGDDARWAALTGADGRAAFEVIRQAWAHPAEAAAFLRDRVPGDADARLASRACEALELPATPAGRALLAEWAAGPPEAPRTREAADTVSRLARSPVRNRSGSLGAVATPVVD